MVKVELPLKLIPVFTGPADVRGAYGGRGSAKTRSFAKMAVIKGYAYGNQGIIGQILCARQYMNSLDDSSLEECKRAIQEEPFLLDYFDIGEKYIKSKDGRIEYTFAGLERNIASVKSKGRILLCWVDEAEAVNEEAWRTLIPTLREEGADWNAELWVTWNPLRKGSPTDLRFRNCTDPLYKVVELNWKDNDKFPAKLERDRLRDMEERPDQYNHVWEGDYLTALANAYFSKELLKARQERRIGHVAEDNLLPFKAFVDIGGTGAKSDAFSMWIGQFVGREIRMLNYYEVVGQPISAHIQWLVTNGYIKERTHIYLPHDGTSHDRVFDVTYDSEFRRAGFTTTTVPNQGSGAATKRIEALRKVFPSLVFNEAKTQPGIDALGWYHEKWDSIRNIGLGPDHDWASHCADAAGLMAIVADDIFNEVNRRPNKQPVMKGWMG